MGRVEEFKFPEGKIHYQCTPFEKRFLRMWYNMRLLRKERYDGQCGFA
jgi:hypothetical protein